MEIYVINFNGAQTGDGHWNAGTFTDRAKADRVAKWLNELTVLNKELWMLERGIEEHPTEQGRVVDIPKVPRTEAMKTMCEVVDQEGYYEVQPEQLHDTAAEWMDWHSQKNHQGMADWPDVADVEAGLADHDPNHALAQEASQLRLF